MAIGSNGDVYVANTDLRWQGGNGVAFFSQNAAVWHLDAEDNTVWTKEAGDNSFACAMALGPDDSVYMIGGLAGTVDLDPGPDTFDLTGNGLFVAKFQALAGPTDISLSQATAQENRPAGTVVGDLSTVAAGGANQFTYTLVSGDGSDDNASFTIVGNELRTNAVFDAAVKSTYSIRVRSTDYFGQSIERVLSVAIVDGPPTVTLTAPAVTNSSSVVVTAVHDGSGVPDGTPVAVDVDLNGDGDFDDDGETARGTGTLIDGTASVVFNPPLPDGAYNVRRVSDQAGNEGTMRWRR